MTVLNNVEHNDNHFMQEKMRSNNEFERIED